MQYAEEPSLTSGWLWLARQDQYEQVGAYSLQKWSHDVHRDKFQKATCRE